MPGVRGHIRGHVIMEGLLVCRVRSGDSAFRLVAFCVTHRFEPVEQLGIMFAAADGDIRQIAGPCGERGHGSAEFRGIGSFDRSDRQRAHRAVLRGEEKVEGCGTGGPADRDDQHIRAILSHERAAAAGDLARDFSRYRERDYRNRGVGVIRVGKRIRGYGHVQADQAVCPADRRRIDIRPVETVAHMHTPRHRFEATADSGQSIGRRARSLFLAAHRLRDRLAVLADPVIDDRAGLVDLEIVGDIQLTGNRPRVQNAEHILRFRGHSGAGGIFRLARGCRSPGCYGEGHRA